MATSDPHLDPREVVNIHFPVTGEFADYLRFLLNYAVLAPSERNSQPWRFRVSRDTISLYADRSRALPVIDPEGRELTIACGAVLFHLRVALRHYGYEGAIKTLPDPHDPDLLARLHLGTPTDRLDPEMEALFQAIPERQSQRTPFAAREIPAELLAALQAAARQEGAWLALVRDESTRRAVAELVVAANQALWSDERFRQELAAWPRPAEEPPPAQPLDAEAGQFLGPPAAEAAERAWQELARQDYGRIMAAPALAILGSADDTRPAWLQAGQALARVLLSAQRKGIAATFLNQPLQVPAIRAQVAGLLADQGYPQMLIRLGYPTAPSDPHSPRRPVPEVLSD